MNGTDNDGYPFLKWEGYNDETAPVLSSVSIDNISLNSGILNFTSNEVGTYYYLIYPSASDAPDAATIKTQGELVSKGTGTVLLGENNIALSGLNRGTEYTAYLVAEDFYENLSDITEIDFTTLPNTVPNRRTGIDASSSQTILINNSYTLSLDGIFEDADNDMLTYQVSINGGDALDITSEYSYKPLTTGLYTLVFTAKDEYTKSVDTYTVTLAVIVKYSFTIISETGGTITAGENSSYEEGTVINIKTLPSIGYSFNKWMSTNGGSFADENSIETTFTMPANDVTITAEYSVNQYTITFNTDGGSLIADITQDYGTAVTVPANPTREGYTFAGWDTSVPTTMPAEDVTVTAQWMINQYTITFDSAGGSAVSSITQDYGTAVTAPADPTREGYTFAGWDTSVPTTMPANNVTITANWTINQYTITFDSAGGTAVSSITQDYATTVIAPATPTKTGYTFAGWDTSVPTTMPAEDFTVTALWTINQYTITFDSAGGTAVSSITQDYGTAVVTPDTPTKTGYTFAGWDTSVPTTMPAENMALTAQWQINIYTLSYAAGVNGTISGATSQSVEYLNAGSAVTAVPDTGYHFVKWSDDSTANPRTDTGIATDISVTAIFEINTYTVTFKDWNGTVLKTQVVNHGADGAAPVISERTGYSFTGWDKSFASVVLDTVVTAQYDINQYTISFNTDGGSSVSSIILDYDEAVTKPTDPIREGYSFAGWDTEIPETMPANNVTIKALWDVNEYTITFDSTGGTAVSSITKDYGTVVTAPADPTKEGYTFAGWDTSVPTTMPANNVTITANWTINQYTITFNSDGGSSVASITQNYGTTITLPSNPTKAGYTFTRWNPSVPTTMPAYNVTITANWTINQYTITFDSAGGTAVSSI
ncbi:MAG: InlB B-repeat-containing protein, partial [Saccharofermentanales bacterium]